MKQDSDKGSRIPRFLLVSAAIIVVGVAIWGWLESRRGDYRALDTALVQPRASGDRLVALMRPVLRKEVGRGSSFRRPEEIEAWLFTLAALLDRLAAEGWWTMERLSFAHVAEIGDRSRWHDAKSLASLAPNRNEEVRKLSNLVMLRTHEAARLMACGATPEAVLGFHDAVSMAGFLCQNPSLVELMNGKEVWVTLMELLDRSVPREHAAEFAVRLPSQSELRWAYTQAIYLYGKETQNMLEDPASVGAGRLWLVDEDRTLFLYFHRMHDMHDYLTGPYDRPLPAFDSLIDWGDNLHNFGGKAMLENSNMVIETFTDGIGLLIALMDRMRVRLLLRAEGGPGDGAAVAALVARLDLRDPYDGKLYRVDQKGRFEVPTGALQHLPSARLGAYFVKR